MSNFMYEEITDENIRDLIETYFDNKDELHESLQDISNWDVSNVTDMSALFEGKYEFNESLNDWDVSNVTSMAYMFNQCSIFNMPLDKWDVSNVTNMEGMFLDCSIFNQPLNSWNVSKVTNMSNMFNECEEFDSPLNSWNVSNVTNMSYMFGTFQYFEQPLNSWNVSSVTSMEGMFRDCSVFNQPLDRWNVANVRNMNIMFEECTDFNQPLTNWNVNNVITHNAMFEGCPIDEENEPRFPVQQIIRTDIHAVSARINYAKLVDFLNKKVNTNISENMDYAGFISSSFLKMINESNESETVKNQLQTRLERIMNERLQNLSYREISPLLLKSVFYSLQYALIQPSEFQSLYLDAFINDCVEAHRGPDSITCAAGALERIITALLNPCQTMLTSSNNEDYQKLIDIIAANPENMIPEYIFDWYKLHKTGGPGAFTSGTSVDQKKENLKEYLLAKFPDQEQLIDSKIALIADNIGYDDDDFMYGGRKSRKFTLKGREKKGYKKNTRKRVKKFTRKVKRLSKSRKGGNRKKTRKNK